MALELNQTTPSMILLRSYFPVVHTLQQYLAHIIQDAVNDEYFLTHETDTMIYRELLKISYVAAPSKVKNCFVTVPPMVPLQELLTRAQDRLLTKSKGRATNVITLGYKKYFDKAGKSRLLNSHLNTIVTAILAPEWRCLFERIGEDAMFHLLTEAYIFVSLPNGCLCQMTGEPLIHTKAPPLAPSVFKPDTPKSCTEQVFVGKKRKKGSHPDEPPLKRCKTHQDHGTSKTDNHVVGKPIEKRTPADISLARVRMFYFRPYYYPHSKIILIGLPPKHILNRLNSPARPVTNNQQQHWEDPDPRKQLEDARHLSKYVFARQYCLSSPFVVNSADKYQAYKIPDYFDREQEIQMKGSCKTPKRLRGVIDLLEKMIWRHGKCGYRPLLEKVCPSKLKTVQSTPLDSSIILEMMSETSIQFCSQNKQINSSISFDSDGNTILPEGLSELHRQVKNKPRFAEFACSPSEVYCYAIVITKAVIPNAFWGSDENFKVICRCVKAFITARRYETLTVHRILQGFMTSECDWLMPDGSKAMKQLRVSVTDSLKRTELLQDFIFWYFDGFLIPLLRTTFYVTESSAFRNKVLYFRQDDWATLCKPLIEKLSSNTFQKVDSVEAHEILRQRKLGFSFVRLLPKETGVRPIVNLRRKKPMMKDVFGRPEQSINQILQAAFQILTYEKDAQKALLGASVFGPNEIYTKLKDFKTRLCGKDGKGKIPKLYFVKLDVQACFDTIEQGKLLEILKQIITEDDYMLQRHGQVSITAGKIKRSYVRKAVPGGEASLKRSHQIK
ncbi:Telomerase reverse transcriptase [Abortiporus biennis]